MSQYVIEFGAEQLRFVADAIKLNLPEPRQICIDSSHGEMSYAETAKTFDEVLNDLAAGTVASAIIRTSDLRIRYALITSPQIHVPRLSLWMGTIEVAVENWNFVWNALLKQVGLRFACVALEEGVELGDEQISPETLPWEADGLLAGAVRTNGESDWTQRVAAPRRQ
jgi:hypothetical protein